MPKATKPTTKKIWKSRRATAIKQLEFLHDRAWTNDQIASAISASLNSVYRWAKGTTTPQGVWADRLAQLVAGVKKGSMTRPVPLVA